MELKSRPHCGKGRLGALKNVFNRGLKYRCNRKACQKFVVPHRGNPLFSCVHGPRSLPFKDQVAALMCLLAGATHTTMRRLLSNVNHKVFEGMSSRLGAAAPAQAPLTAVCISAHPHARTAAASLHFQFHSHQGLRLSG